MISPVIGDIPDPLPKPVLSCGDVMLRPLGAEDAQAMFASLDEPETRRLTGTHKAYSFEDVRAHCARIEADPDRVDYGIVVDGALIGEVVLNSVDRDNRVASLRIAVWESACRDRGFGTQAMRLMLSHAFDAIGLNRVELEVYSFNARAMRVYERLGFVREGARRHALLWDGDPVDAIVMGLLGSEWRAANAE